MRASALPVRQWRRFIIAMLTLVVLAMVVPAPTQAYRYHTGALTGSTGTAGSSTQTFASGVTARWTTAGAGNVYVNSLTAVPSSRGATSAMFTPSISAATPMTDFVVNATGCATSDTCSGRGTIALTFSRPVRNPTLHFTGH